MQAPHSDSVPASVHEALARVLERLPDASAAVLARTDGLELGSALRGALSPSRIAAIASAMLVLGQASLREMALGNGDSLLVAGSNGKFLLYGIPLPQCPAVLAIVAGTETMTGSLVWAARSFASELRGAD